MAAKKKNKSTTVNVTTTAEPITLESPRGKFFNTKTVTIILGVLALGALVYWKQNWFIAATVNGSPITTLELQRHLNDNFKKEGLEQLINSKIVYGEAVKNNAVPNKEEIEQEYDRIAAGYGGREQFNKILETQGQNPELFQKEVREFLSLKKMYSSEASASDKEIDDYIKINKSLLKATGSAEQKIEAENAIKEQNLLRIIQEKFQELKNRAIVRIF